MRAVAALALLGVGLAGCAAPPASPSRAGFLPTRWDYEAFQRSHPGIADPNYLPFMTHRFQLAESPEDVLVFCRWPDARLPLAVFVEPPAIDESLQDEFNPKEPADYVDAVDEALATWEESLGTAHFRRVADAGEADLTIRLVGAEGPVPSDDVQVLGTTPLYGACRVAGGDPASGVLDVTFEVNDLDVYVADRYGLLPADQVGRLALHEIGHALGMMGHSPIPADLMYEVARDSRVEALSPEDRNSFRALYAVPNGTVYLRVPRDASPGRSDPALPDGPPLLRTERWVDEGLGFALGVPVGWRVIPAPRGVVAVDGVAWDYEASFQVIVRSYPSLESYLDRHAASHVGHGEILEQGGLRVAGRSAFGFRVLQRGGDLIESHVFVPSGDGRVLVVIAECPTALRDDFDPWFLAMLESLEVRERPVHQLGQP